MDEVIGAVLSVVFEALVSVLRGIGMVLGYAIEALAYTCWGPAPTKAGDQPAERPQAESDRD